MNSRLMVASAGHGKTRYAIQRIRDVTAAEPLVLVTVIVPNQMRAAEFHRRLAMAGGALGANVVTFHTLYADILARAGQPRPRLLEPVQVRLLRMLVDRLCDAESMPFYAGLRAKPGFIAALREMIEELKRARIEPDQFAASARGLTLGIDELAAVYSAYQDWLLRENWADREGQGWLAAIALEQQPALGADTRLLVVNGFDEFNPTQLGVLALLAPRTGETLITLTGDLSRAQPRPAHRRFERARRALTDALHLTPESLGSPAGDATPRYSLPAPLARLEADLFEAGAATVPGEARTSQTRWPRTVSESSETPPVVTLVEGRDRATETRTALRWIKARIVRDGMALSEVGVLARDLGPYRALVEEIADEFGLPVRLTGGLPLATNPAVAAVRSVLSLPALGWPRRLVIEAWQSPYLDWSHIGITAVDTAMLDDVSRLGHVQSGLAQWRQALDLVAGARSVEDADEDEAVHPPDLDAVTLRSKFEAFAARCQPPENARMREYVAYVEDVIGDDPAFAPHAASNAPDAVSLNVVHRARETAATAERDSAALRGLKDVLRGLALAETAIQITEVMDYPAFFTELTGAIQSASYAAASETGVLIASVLDARGISLRAVALLGLSEGEFPRPEREDIFLRERERRVLNARGLPVEPKLRGDEMTFFYLAVTRASEQLLLTRPYLADDGQSWEPSPYWQEARRILPAIPVRRAQPEDALDPSEAASAPEHARAARLLGAPVERDLAILRARLDHAGHGDYDGDLTRATAALRARYPANHVWSASRLEAYGACPFYFYIAYALELEPRRPPEEGYDVRILGTMLHRILEETYRQAADPCDVNACLSAMEAVADTVMAGAPGEYGFRPTPMWPRQQRELRDILRRTLTALSEASAGCTPRHFEARFGTQQNPFVLDTPAGGVRLHGTVDRIDVDSSGRLHIIDYKTGGTPISPRHLTEGRRLQLPLYALAARDALGLGEIAGGFYWHIQSASRSSLKLEDYPGGPEGALAIALQHIAAHVGGILSGRFQPAPPADGCPHYCPATAFCWHYN